VAERDEERLDHYGSKRGMALQLPPPQLTQRLAHGFDPFRGWLRVWPGIGFGASLAQLVVVYITKKQIFGNHIVSRIEKELRLLPVNAAKRVVLALRPPPDICRRHSAADHVHLMLWSARLLK
jgi:hypothetical protein